MKSLLRYAAVALSMLALATTGWGQSRGGGGGSAPSSSSSVGSSSTTSSASGSRSDGGFSSSSSGSYSSPGVSYSSGRGGYSGSGGYVPNLNGTSWSSANTWYQWQMYYNWMQLYYYLNPQYFSRFSRNVEPLATPDLVKLTYRRPLKISLQMLDSIDELAEMLQPQAGKQVDKQAVLTKLQEIRELNKQILKDQGVDFLDQRRDKEVFTGMKVDKLDLDSINKLREMITDLSTQLKNTYTQATPSVVSVQSLSQPSFKSMCKEIDKVSKTLENSARRM